MVTKKSNSEPEFPTIAHCGIYLIYHYGEVWSNARLAEEVKQRMGSNTGAGNISWYKVNLKKGKLKVEKYVDTSVEPISRSMEKPKKVELPKKPVAIGPQIDNPLEVKPETLYTPTSNNPIQNLAMEFFTTKTDRSFRALYNRLKPGLTYHASNIIKDQTLTDDVVNVAFTKIWQKIDQYNPHWCFSTWAYKIVKNEAMQLVRREQKFSSMEDAKGGDKTDVTQYSEYAVKAAEETWIPDYLEDNEEDFNQMVYEKVLREIQALPKTYKDIMIDRELNEMKYKDIAKKHKININSVKTRIKRARTQIQSNNEEYMRIVERRNKSRKNEAKEESAQKEIDIFEQARLKVEASSQEDICSTIV